MLSNDVFPITKAEDYAMFNYSDLEVRRNAHSHMRGVCSSLHNCLSDRRANRVAYDSLGLQARINITYILIRSNKMQQYAGIYLLEDYSTCFGCPSLPSSGVHKNVTAASGTGHSI